MAQIIETKNIVDVLNYVDDNTLVIFDIDNTLIEPVQTFGGYAWALYQTKRFLQKGLSEQEALKQSYALYNEVKKSVNFKPVQTETVQTLTTLQQRQIKPFALTVRASTMAHSTTYDLHTANIAFSKTPFYKDPITFNPLAGYVEGIVYTGPTSDKGNYLLSFLNQINYTPQHIVFIDDSKDYVQNVSATLQAHDIEHQCIRYGATDERENQFDPQQADNDLRATIGDKQFEKLFKELL